MANAFVASLLILLSERPNGLKEVVYVQLARAHAMLVRKII